MVRSRDMSRRDAIRTVGTAVAAAGLVACKGKVNPSPKDRSEMTQPTSERMPAVFLPHGGGPWPWMSSQQAAYRAMRSYMEGLAAILPSKPRAVLVVSAHWEAPVATVMAAPNPPMLYDYSGFPPETYEVTWPAPGAADVAADIEAMLKRAGIAAARDETRGFDHGAFVPLALTYPRADVPTLQLSLVKGLDPAEHLRMGAALAPLREQGVFVVGSGMSYHNMRAFMQFMRGGPAPTADSRVFDDWLAESMTQGSQQRESLLAAWDKAPAARACHPREEHLIPLHVVAGMAGDDKATIPYRDVVIGAHVSAVQFG